MILTFGVGRIWLSQKGITDGVIFFRTISPALIWRILFNHKRNLPFSGQFIAINDVIIWIRKLKDGSKMQTEFDKYSRKDIKEWRDEASC